MSMFLPHPGVPVEHSPLGGQPFPHQVCGHHCGDVLLLPPGVHPAPLLWRAQPCEGEEGGREERFGNDF